MAVSAATDDVEVPDGAAAVARRYRRIERPVSSVVALLVAAAMVVAYLQLPLLQALVAWVGILGLVRLPVYGTGGTARLLTDADPASVREDFESATPPPLALQWGIADRVRATETGGTYDVSYLLGLRSTTMGTEVRSDPDATGDPDADLALVVSAGGRPWGTYSVTIEGLDGGTVLDVSVTSDRRFGLRRLPQRFVAERFRDDALAAQGYAVVERESSLSF